MFLGRTAPEVVEADFVHRGGRGVARDMAAVLGALAIRLHDHRHRIPAQVGLDAAFERAVPRVLGLAARRNRVQVSRVRAVRQVGAGAAREIDHLVEQEMRTLGPVLCQHGINRLEPLGGLNRINVIKWIESAHKSFTIGFP